MSERIPSLSDSSVCKFTFLAGEYDVFHPLWGSLMDPDVFSGILAVLGVHVHVFDASVWLLSLTG